MKLSEYFQKTTGRAVLATAGSDGKVDVAIYARPDFIDEERIAFIMADRLTHKNLQSNSHAAYLFMESGEPFAGKRLFLTKMKEGKDSELIEKIRRKESCPVYEEYRDEIRHLVYFHIDKDLPLIGGE